MPPYWLVLDANAPWVRSLVEALPGVREGRETVDAWRVYGLRYFWPRRRGLRSGECRSAARPDRAVRDRCRVVPGWDRWPGVSSWLLGREVRAHLERHGSPVAILYTSPHYARVARRFGGERQVYYAYDAFALAAGSGGDRVREREAALLGQCSLAFAVSGVLVDDLRALSGTRVVYSPNGVDRQFVEAVRRAEPIPAAEFGGAAGGVVGCIGQISAAAYDWAYLEHLARAFPAARFVLVGPKREEGGDGGGCMARVLGLPNVVWVGARPRDELPRWLRSFDVCLSPLALNPFNIRRSPLRLYDSLATDRPILSTALPEAVALGAHVEATSDPVEAERRLRRMLAGEGRVQVGARARFVAEQTWECRAAALAREVRGGGRPEESTPGAVAGRAWAVAGA